MARPRRNIVLTIHAEDWDRLVSAGKASERDPYQHARWLLLRGLASDTDQAPAADPPEREVAPFDSVPSLRAS